MCLRKWNRVIFQLGRSFVSDANVDAASVASSASLGSKRRISLIDADGMDESSASLRENGIKLRGYGCSVAPHWPRKAPFIYRIPFAARNSLKTAQIRSRKASLRHAIPFASRGTPQPGPSLAVIQGKNGSPEWPGEWAENMKELIQIVRKELY